MISTYLCLLLVEKIGFEDHTEGFIYQLPKKILNVY